MSHEGRTRANVEAYQQRVIEEKIELDDRIDKLHRFFDNPIYKSLQPIDQLLLQSQYSTMNALTQILTMRIARFRTAES